MKFLSVSKKGKKKIENKNYKIEILADEPN